MNRIIAATVAALHGDRESLWPFVVALCALRGAIMPSLNAGNATVHFSEQDRAINGLWEFTIPT